jgi:hypothetical protein
VFDGVKIGVIRRPVNSPNSMFLEPFGKIPVNINRRVILYKWIASFIKWEKTFLEDVVIGFGSYSSARGIGIPVVKYQF